MNETDELILDAFKQQSLVDDKLIGEIQAEINSIPESEVTDRNAVFMDTLLEKTGMPKAEIINYLSGELNMEAIDLSDAQLPEETLFSNKARVGQAI